MKRLVAILFWISSLGASAQDTPVTIPGSAIRKITSSIVAGQEYELQILLPGGYQNNTKKYPVLYLMDAQWDFPLLKSVYGQQYYDGFIPELIIVGVTWGGVKPNPDSLRARDYTPTKEARLPQSGGADLFLSFMQQELFPYMEKNYRVNHERELAGCSLGGLFTLYAWLTHTDMFSGYVAASPAVGWDREVLYQFEKLYATKKSSGPVRVYMTVGDVERGRPGFEKMADLFRSRHYPQVTLVSKVLENTGHSGTKSETYTRGLQFVFERKKLELDETLLKLYAGTYELPGGVKLELKKEGNKLIWFYSPQNKLELLANSETHLYALHEFFNLYFRISNGQVEGFDWARYGGTQFVRKIK